MINFIKPFLSPLKSVWQLTPFSGAGKSHVTILSLSGVIGAGGAGSRRTLSYERMEKAIEAAFKPDNLSAVALSINSPGGSPVQSRLIFAAIRRLADEKKVPVLAFIEDVGASGGYMLAVAGDEIYADESSIVGSIGVISGGFGFPKALEKLGVERRVYTAGTNKSQLDSFAPEKPEDIAHLKTILDDTHEKFIALVKSRRGDKISDAYDDIFTGSFWTTTGAKQRGLVDGSGHLKDMIIERFGKDVVMKKCEPQGTSLLSKLTGAASVVDPLSGREAMPSGSLIDLDQALCVIEEKALYARYGL